MTGYAKQESREAVPIPGMGSEGDDLGPLSACFEYTGPTALVLTGPYTGHRYYFRQPGARLRVDGRDGHSLMAVPVLRAIAA